MAESRDRNDFFGKFKEHFDENGKKIGESREMTGLMGKYIEHRDADGNKIGESQDMTGVFGEYTKHRDKDFKKTGESREMQGIFGEYTEHSDKDFKKTGESRKFSGLGGDHTKHEGSGWFPSNKNNYEKEKGEGPGCVGYGILGVLILVVIYFIFTIVVPLFILNFATLFLLISLFAVRFRKILYITSFISLIYLIFDINSGLLTSHLMKEISLKKDLIDVMFYLNTSTGVVSLYLFLSNYIKDKLESKSNLEATKEQNKQLKKYNLIITISLILMWVLIFFGYMFMGTQRSNTYPTNYPIQNNNSSQQNQTHSQNQSQPQNPTSTQQPQLVIEPFMNKLSNLSSVASSNLPPSNVATYIPNNVLDNSTRTVWVENAVSYGVGEWIEIQNIENRFIQRIGIANGYDKGERFTQNCRVKLIEVQFSNGQSYQLNLADIPSIQYFDFPPVRATFIRFIIKSVYPGSKWEDTAISEIELWGKNGK